MKLHFTYRAARDLQRLRTFIPKDNPLAARHKIDGLRRSIRRLLDQPYAGREIDEASHMRQWISGDYVVRYFVDFLQCSDHRSVVIRAALVARHRS